MWVHCNEVVLDAVSFPSGPVDISSVVGEQRALVLFKAVEAGEGEFGGGRFIRIGSHLAPVSANYLSFSPFKLSGFLIATTDSSGVINVSGTEKITLTVVGYTTALFDDTTIFGPDTLISEVGDTMGILAENSLGLFEWTQTAGNEALCQVKLYSDQNDHLDGVNACKLSEFGSTGLTLSPTDNGLVQLFNPQAGTDQIDLVALLGSEHGWTNVSEQAYYGLPPEDWTALDLHELVGNQVVLVVLRVAILPDYSEDEQYFAFKSNDDASLDYLPYEADGYGASAGHSNYGAAFYTTVETDSDGIIQWMGTNTHAVEVLLLGYVEAAPAGPALFVDYVQASSLVIRVYFNEGVVNDSELRDVANYSIAPSSPEDSIGIDCISVTPDPLNTNPLYVDLEVTDCTNRAEYVVTIVPDRIQNSNGDFIGRDGNTATYNGVSESPSVLLAISTSETTYKVTFSKPMAQNADLVDPRNYIFSDNLRCTKVTVENYSTVILTTTKQTKGHIYTLTVG